MTSTTAHGKKPLSTISQSFCRFISLMLTAMSTGQREEKRVGSGQLAVGSWQLAVGSWQLAVGSWQLAVGSNMREKKKQ